VRHNTRNSGSVKETTGKILDDSKLAAEDEAEKAKGEFQNAVGLQGCAARQIVLRPNDRNRETLVQLKLQKRTNNKKEMTMEQKNPNGLRQEGHAFAASAGQFKENARNNPGASASDSVARGKEAIGNAASEAMNSAGSDLDSLRSDLNNLKDTMTKFVSQAGGEAAKSAREVANNVYGQVNAAASDLADRGAEMASTATAQAKSFATELENMTRRNPLGAIAGAVMVGVLIGMLGRRS
jgi:ElaB/YqjD/DUF883 family membrane-anchored ribosome-binding protein/uncharacterized protein YjbJ (UPF0337 family)